MIRALKSFEAYPDAVVGLDGRVTSNGRRRSWIAGAVIRDVSEECAALYVAKGLAERIEDTAEQD